jgi:hypothetical protein
MRALLLCPGLATVSLVLSFALGCAQAPTYTGYGGRQLTLDEWARAVEGGDVEAVHSVHSIFTNNNESARAARRPALLILVKALEHPQEQVRMAAAWSLRQELGSRGPGSGEEWAEKLRTDQEIGPTILRAAKNSNTFVHACLAPFTLEPADTGLSVFLDTAEADITWQYDSESEVVRIDKQTVLAEAGFRRAESEEVADLVLSDVGLWDAASDLLVAQFRGNWWIICFDLDRQRTALPRFGLTRQKGGQFAVAIASEPRLAWQSRTPSHSDVVRVNSAGNGIRVHIRPQIGDDAAIMPADFFQLPTSSGRKETHRNSPEELTLAEVLLNDGFALVRKEKNADVILEFHRKTSTIGQYTDGEDAKLHTLAVRLLKSGDNSRVEKLEFLGGDPSTKVLGQSSPRAINALIEAIKREGSRVTEAVRKTAAQ